MAVFPLLIMGSGFFFMTRSTGFGIEKIVSRLDYNPSWETITLSERQRELLTQEVFSQKYYYLGAGNHCYAFISEDRKYVLKFFKMQHLLPKGWLNGFPVSLFQKFGIKNETGHRLFAERIFTGYKAAYESLQEETGMLYIHLNKSCEFRTMVTLIDNKGKKYPVDIDSFEFIVQKSARKIFEHFTNLLDEGKNDDLRASINSFLQLIASRCEKGFSDPDLSIRNNFGFIGNSAIQFDCATLTEDSSMKYPLNFRHEVMQVVERLNQWANENCPEITIFIQEEAQRIVNSYFS